MVCNQAHSAHIWLQRSASDIMCPKLMHWREKRYIREIASSIRVCSGYSTLFHYLGVFQIHGFLNRRKGEHGAGFHLVDLPTRWMCLRDLRSPAQQHQGSITHSITVCGDVLDQREPPISSCRLVKTAIGSISKNADVAKFSFEFVNREFCRGPRCGPHATTRTARAMVWSRHLVQFSAAI